MKFDNEIDSGKLRGGRRWGKAMSLSCDNASVPWPQCIIIVMVAYALTAYCMCRCVAALSLEMCHMGTDQPERCPAIRHLIRTSHARSDNLHCHQPKRHQLALSTFTRIALPPPIPLPLVPLHIAAFKSPLLSLPQFLPPSSFDSPTFCWPMPQVRAPLDTGQPALAR